MTELLQLVKEDGSSWHKSRLTVTSGCHKWLRGWFVQTQGIQISPFHLLLLRTCMKQAKLTINFNGKAAGDPVAVLPHNQGPFVRLLRPHPLLNLFTWEFLYDFGSTGVVRCFTSKQERPRVQGFFSDHILLEPLG